MTPRSAVLALVIAASAVAATPQASNETFIRVLPTPQSVKEAPLVFKLTSQTRIILGSHTTAADEFAVRQINERLAELQRGPLRLAREESMRKIARDYIYLGSPEGAFAAGWLKSNRISFEPQMKDEGYVLDVSQDGVVIVGPSAAGRFYGVTTLLQLLEQQKKSIVLHGMTIVDWPQQRFRGVTDDISRGQVSTMENFKAIIRSLARYKLNVYSPYIEDVFAFKQHPRIGEGRGALTAVEVKELDRYAKQYHVEIIPIFETLGHWENILLLPEYLQYAEFPGASALNVSNEAIYPLLDGMIGEVAAAFSSSYFNMAADESFNVGLGGSKARVAASDLATVHADHYKRLFEILKKYKKKPMMYGDIILANPSILDKIPKSTIIVDWQYDPEERYPSTETFKDAGFPFIVSPTVSNYNGPFPHYLNTTLNVQTLTREGFRNGSLGVLTSNWNNFGGESLRELTAYGYAWTAECAWRPLEAKLERFSKIYFRDFFGDDRSGLIGQTVYALLSAPLNQLNWHEVWRHPLLPLRQSAQPMILRLESLRSSLPLLRQYVAELGESAPRHRDHVRLLLFIVNLHEWFLKKIVIAENLKAALDSTRHRTGIGEGVGARLAEARELVTELRRLKNEFSSLWLKTNRSANLHLLMKKYDRQIEYWEEIIRSVEQAGVLYEPLIVSKWIYHPEANPGKRDSALPQVRKTYFRTSVQLQQPPSGARLQLIGDTHVRLWINGHQVGELYARRSPSLTVEHQRVKIWDIGSFLRTGDNILAVEAANYDRFGSAGMNLYAELNQGTKSMRIVSDSSWQVSVHMTDDWKTSLTGEEKWIQAKTMQYLYLVVRPDLENGRVSWIER